MFGQNSNERVSPPFCDQLTIYVRYVDDIGKSLTLRSGEEAQTLLAHVNSPNFSQTIKFEMELSDKKEKLPAQWPILDLRMAITPDGTTDRRLHSKPANKRITLHYKSHYSSSTNKAMIQNELQHSFLSQLCSSVVRQLQHSVLVLIKTLVRIPELHCAFSSGPAVSFS